MMSKTTAPSTISSTAPMLMADDSSQTLPAAFLPNTNTSASTNPPTQPATPAPTGESLREHVLAELISAGAIFYGAGWCSFTRKQLASLGLTKEKFHHNDTPPYTSHPEISHILFRAT